VTWLWEHPSVARQLACGLVLGIYLWTWSRGAAPRPHRAALGRDRNVGGHSLRFHVTRTLAPVLAIAVLMILPIAFLLPAMTVTVPITVAGIAAIALAEAVASVAPPRVARLVTVGLGLAAVLVAWWLLPHVRAQLTPVPMSAGMRSIGEIQPMLFPGGRFSLESRGWNSPPRRCWRRPAWRCWPGERSMRTPRPFGS
jgi:hypothetical protein